MHVNTGGSPIQKVVSNTCVKYERDRKMDGKVITIILRDGSLKFNDYPQKE